MNIGQASKASGVSAKMIRYYESIDLIPSPARRSIASMGRWTFTGWRSSAARVTSASRLSGFGSCCGCGATATRSSAEVKAIALEHVAELKQRARHLNEMADALKHLASACEGDHRPECPIIKGLEGEIPIDLHCTEASRKRRIVEPVPLGSKTTLTRRDSRAAACA